MVWKELEAGSNNCHSTASAMKPWKWPTTKNRDAAIQELKSVLEAYPKDDLQAFQRVFKDFQRVFKDISDDLERVLNDI